MMVVMTVMVTTSAEKMKIVFLFSFSFRYFEESKSSEVIKIFKVKGVDIQFKGGLSILCNTKIYVCRNVDLSKLFQNYLNGKCYSAFAKS
jgi:hypothetical protein